MIYFFSKDSQYVQCEIYPGRPHVLRIIRSGGNVRTERYTTSAELQLRLDHVYGELSSDGWIGPFGRDSRI